MNLEFQKNEKKIRGLVFIQYKLGKMETRLEPNSFLDVTTIRPTETIAVLKPVKQIPQIFFMGLSIPHPMYAAWITFIS